MSAGPFRLRAPHRDQLLPAARPRTALAERCGFSSTAHLACFFRLHTNQTIDAFRAFTPD